jgi:transcriptional regulator with XRE-family HTH domain
MTALAKKMRMEGKSQKKVADEIGCDQTTVSTWVRGEFRPRVQHYPGLARYLRVSEDELCDMIEAGYKKTDGGRDAR